MADGMRIGRRARVAVVAARLALGVAFVSGAFVSAHAREAAPMAADPALEARVMVVAEELRCLVCQNETIAASQADLAKDLRAQIRVQLQEGRTPQQILDFMVVRYGEFVLYRPPVQASTWLLWGGPFVLLMGAAGWLVMRVRQRPATSEATLSPDEQRRVQKLLDEGGAS